MNKRFSIELYNKYDEIACAVAKILLPKYLSIDSLVNSPDKKGVDLIGLTNFTHKFNVEVEVKTSWAKGLYPFPHKTIHILSRKRKFCLLRKPTLFCIFSLDFCGALLIPGSVLLKSPTEIISNRYMRLGESFFKIDLDKVRCIHFSKKEEIRKLHWLKLIKR